MDLTWMNTLVGPRWRPSALQKVTALDVDGVKAAIATDGRALTLVFADSAPADAFPHSDYVKRWLRELSAIAKPMPFAKLVQWIGDIGPDSVTCTECIRGKVECEVCDEPHACCEFCGGTGEIQGNRAWGLAGGVAIDRRLVRLYLGPLTAEEIMVAVPKDWNALPIFFCSPGKWAVFVMAMRDGDGPELLANEVAA